MNESINNNKINRSSPFDNNFDQTTEADNKTHEQIADCCATDDDDKSQDCTMVKSSKENKKLKSQLPSDSEVLALMGDATTAIFLLRNYDKFGLAERVCYHFDLTEALTASEESNSSNGDEVHPSTCGVVSLLECAVLTPWQKLLKRQRRALKNEILGFNMAAAKVHRERPTACYQPKKLPLRFNPSTRMFFAYEVTRIAFCVDASYSLTSTFGVGGSSNNPCCPLDRLPEMARTFFNSLVLPVPASSMTDPGVWKPVLSVTVIAVFPGKTSETSLLVRDYRVHNVESSEILANRINEWIHSEVEFGISERMCRHTANAWGIPLFSSSLRDILEVGDYCLSVLSSEAKPVIVVATDCRSVSCDGIVDVFLDINRVDAPVVILDLSIPETHSMEEQPRQALAGKNELNFLTYDPGGPSAFPLHLSDDSEALYGICRATGGCFLDFNLLTEGSKSVAGQNPVTETAYHYTFKRRFVKMNGVQWLVLFSLSPLSPTFHSAWAKLAPPEYLRKRLNMGMVDAHITTEGQNALHFSRHDNYAKQGSDSVNSPGPSKKLHTHSRVTCSIYVVSPIRIKALLLMRIKEGYRARQYGLSTQDADKVFIQFTLPLELGTVLHYELQYKALSSQNHMIGSAHIKIELSGDKGFIQSVKKDFLRQVPPDRPFTMAQKVSARLCQVLKWIRTEDCLQSYICPPSRWSDQLSSSGTPFVKRLGSMTKLQRRRHFQFDEFDVICTGRIPYTLDDDFLSEFIAVDSGEHELMDQISGWATQAVQPNSIYVKSLSTLEGMTAYCLIEIVQSPIAPRLFSMSVQFYGGTDPSDRHGLVNSFKNALRSLKSVSVLAKQMGPYLLGGSKSSFWKKRNVEIQHHHERWDLLKDSELLPLVMKRRMDLGNFLLLQSNDDLALFAKLAPEDLLKNKQGPDTHKVTSPGDLIQYQFESLSDKVVVDLHMESECGTFFPFRVHGNEASRFNALVQKLRQRDQECGRALRSRTNLLRVFQAEDSNALEQVGAIEESHRSSVSRILAYSSKVSRRLRFFNGAAGTANDILAQMTENLLLSNSFGVQAAKLDLDPNELIKDEDTGLWFIIKFDRHTMSIVHLSSVDKKGGSEASESQTYRDLTFFTNGIGDLYSKRDDMVDDDDSADSHISEYLCVTEFADHFEIAQKENFAAAAYLSLRNDGQLLTESFDKGDFAEVLRTCEFVEVTSVSLVGVESSDHENPMIIDQSKLYLLINTIFRLVPGDEQCMFYCGYGNVEELLSMGGDESDSTDSMNASIDLSLDNPSADDDGHFGNDDDSDGRSQLYKRIVPPIFVRFQLDGEQASLKDLHQISRSATLAAQMSVFKNERTTTTPPANAGLSDLPWSHQVAAIELTALLKSYVAEQTIERLRHHGSSISDENLCQVQRCLKRVRSVVSFSIEVYFYVSKTNLMVPASAPAGGESEVEEGFLLLNSELRNNGAFELRPVPGGGFVVVSGKDRIDEALEFWCFVYVQKSDGIVSSQLYHRDGEEKAMMVMSKIHDVVCVCVHRANQQLLLKR